MLLSQVRTQKGEREYIEESYKRILEGNRFGWKLLVSDGWIRAAARADLASSLVFDCFVHHMSTI